MTLIMDDTAREDNAWRLAGSIGEFTAGAFSARVDVSRPELGLQHVALHGRPLDARLLCIGRDAAEPSARHWPVADAYVRGGDLVAAYRPQDDWPFLPQVYWRANASASTGEPLCSLSLFISVQTHLLDTWPRIQIQSQVPADESLLIAAGGAAAAATSLSSGQHTIRPTTGPACVLQRLASQQFSYAEIMPASDFRELSIASDAKGSCGTRWELFGDFLEKGVIWRARLHAILLPRENDIALARAFCLALEKRPLPLTT